MTQKNLEEHCESNEKELEDVNEKELEEVKEHLNSIVNHIEEHGKAVAMLVSEFSASKSREASAS